MVFEVRFSVAAIQKHLLGPVPGCREHCNEHSSEVPALLGAYTCCRCFAFLPWLHFLRYFFFCLPLALYALRSVVDPPVAANPWLHLGAGTALSRTPSETTAPLQQGGSGWASQTHTLTQVPLLPSPGPPLYYSLEIIPCTCPFPGALGRACGPGFQALPEWSQQPFCSEVVGEWELKER